MNEFLSGPTAIAVSNEEEVLPAQILKKFADEHEVGDILECYTEETVAVE